MYALNAWRKTPIFSDRERAAPEWTEAVTLIAQGHTPDDVYNRVREHFSEEETVALTFAITTINNWKRLAIALRSFVPGTYQPKKA